MWGEGLRGDFSMRSSKRELRVLLWEAGVVMKQEHDIQWCSGEISSIRTTLPSVAHAQAQ